MPPQNQSLCPCGFVAVQNGRAAALCGMAGGNVPPVGTAAAGNGTPQTGMAGAAKLGASTGKANAVPTNPNAPRNAGPAAGGGLAGAAAVTAHCAKVGILCVPK